MWLKRSLALLVLLTSASPSHSGPPPPPPPGSPEAPSGAPESKGTTSKTDAGGWFSKGIGLLSSVSTNVGLISSDNIDKRYITKVYRTRALDVLKKMEWSCVRGSFHEVKKGESMKTWNVRILDIKDMADFEVGDVKETGDGFVTSEVLFKYPEMVMTSDFQYDSTVAGFPYSKIGTAKIRVGPADVKVSVKLPNSKTTIDEEPDKKKCFNTITPDGITVSNEKFEIINLEYPITFKSKSLRFSHSSMVEIINNMKKDILMNLEDYLKHHVALSVKDIVFSCLDDKAAEKWKPLKPDDYCKESIPTTDYGAKV